jgi:dCTP diphosphatase
VEDRNWDQFHNSDNLAKSISIEAGELLECFQWNDKYDINDVKDELADVMIYCILLARKLNLDISDIIREKNKKCREKYPVEKAKGNAIKYTKL